MSTNTPRYSVIGILALISMLSFSGCSQKPSSEEIAAQVKAALAEEKAKEQAAAPTPAPVAEHDQKPAAATARPRATHAQAAPAAPAEKIVCANCGVVVSVKEVDVEGQGSGLGVIAGGVAGGVLGHQVGQGTGRDLATVAGVVGGAIAGNTIEKKVKKTKVYDVTVRMENGEERLLRVANIPGVVTGDKVKVEGDRVVRQ